MRHTFLFLGLLGSIAAQAIGVSSGNRPETCGNSNGSVWCGAFGGQAPYTYAWTGPNGFTASVDSLYGLVGGSYTVLVTDALGATATATEVVESLANLPAGVGPSYAAAYPLTGYWGGACAGLCNGAGGFADHVLQGSLEPYTYTVPGTYLGFPPDFNGPVYGGFCLGDWIDYSFVDALGCTGTGSFVVYGVDETWNPQVQSVEGACTGGSIGSITGASNSPIDAQLTLRLDGAVVEVIQVWSLGPFTFAGLAPGTYELETSINASTCVIYQQIEVPDLGPDCAGISGNSWFDVDGDCVRDGNEVGIPGSVLSIAPGDHFALTNSSGDYSLNLPAGAYTLTQTDPTLVPICPATQPVPFAITGTPVVQDLANGSTQPLDLGIQSGTTFARPGFATRLYATARNHSPQPSGPVTVTCTYDPALTYVGTTPTPTVNGNTLTWELPAFNSYGAASFQVDLVVPVATPLGTELVSTWTVSNTLPDANAANDAEVSLRTVTGSYDPNVKEVRTSSRQSNTQYVLGVDQYLDYTIHFQNTGTDTAFTVVVTDTLDATLDMASFQQGTSSHPCMVEFLVDRVVRWTFPDILLVDSTTNEAGSHGLTTFRIRLAPPIVSGTLIPNAADIFFDFNAPIRTPDALIVTDALTGLQVPTIAALQLVPNPAHDRLSVVGAPDAVRVRMLSADGRQVLEHDLRNGTTWSVSALPAGLYMVQVLDASGAMRSTRVVKQ